MKILTSAGLVGKRSHEADRPGADAGSGVSCSATAHLPMNADETKKRNEATAKKRRARKFSDDQIREILRRRREGCSAAMLSRIYRVARSTIWDWSKDERFAESPQAHDGSTPTPTSPPPTSSPPSTADLAIIASSLVGEDNLEKIGRAARIWDLAEEWLHYKRIGDDYERERNAAKERVAFEQAIATVQMPQKGPKDWLNHTLSNPEGFRRVLDRVWMEVQGELYQACGGKALFALLRGDEEFPIIEAEEVESIINHWVAAGLHPQFVENLREFRAEEYSLQKRVAGAEGGRTPKKKKPRSRGNRR